MAPRTFSAALRPEICGLSGSKWLSHQRRHTATLLRPCWAGRGVLVGLDDQVPGAGLLPPPEPNEAITLRELAPHAPLRPLPPAVGPRSPSLSFERSCQPLGPRIHLRGAGKTWTCCCQCHFLVTAPRPPRLCTQSWLSAARLVPSSGPSGQRTSEPLREQSPARNPRLGDGRHSWGVASRGLGHAWLTVSPTLNRFRPRFASWEPNPWGAGGVEADIADPCAPVRSVPCSCFPRKPDTPPSVKRSPFAQTPGAARGRGPRTGPPLGLDRVSTTGVRRAIVAGPVMFPAQRHSPTNAF